MPRATFVLTLVSLMCLLIGPAPAQDFEAGAAKVDATPPLGAPLNGYLKRWGRGAVEIHDPIFARCIYLDDGSTRVFLVSVDLCLITPELRERVLELAPPVVTADNIFLAATHTHNGPGGMWRGVAHRFASGRFMPELLEQTAAAISDAMAQAYDNRRRAAIGYGTFEQDDMTENRSIEDGPVDPQVGIIRVEDADGAPIAILANMAAHPTTIDVDGPHMLSVSADFPGFYCSELEELAGGECVALFMNGAVGDQECAARRESGWEYTQAVGEELASRVWDEAEDIVCGKHVLRTSRHQMQMPPTLADVIAPASAPLQALEINGLAMSFIPGEPTAELGLRLRERATAAGYDAHFTIGLANDYAGYFVARERYASSAQESERCVYGPGAGERLVKESAALLDRAAGGQDAPEPAATTAAEDRVFRASGSAQAVGKALGRRYSTTLRRAFGAYVSEPFDQGLLRREDAIWNAAPHFVRAAPLALPMLGIASRSALSGAWAEDEDEEDAPLREEQFFAQLEGMAEGAGLPFDAVMLLQGAPIFSAQAHMEPAEPGLSASPPAGDGAGARREPSLFDAPKGMTAAIVGERAGVQQLLLAADMHWPDAQDLEVVQIGAEDSHAYLSIGPPWLAGAFAGMNDAGVVIVAERAEELGMPRGGPLQAELVIGGPLDVQPPAEEGPSVQMVLGAALAGARDLEEAEAILEEAEHLRGWRVIVAAPHASQEDGTPEAVRFEFGERVSQSESDDGMLLGSSAPDAGRTAAGGARAGYARVQALLKEDEPVDASALQELLEASAPAGSGFRAIFVPAERSVLLSTIGADGQASSFDAVRLKSEF